MIEKVLLFTLTSRQLETYRFAGSVNQKGDPFIMFGGKRYDSMVIEYKRETQTRDSDMRAEITVYNASFEIDGKKYTLADIARQEQWFYGWQLEIKDVYQRFLDAENFISGENPDADHTQGIVESWTMYKVNQLTFNAIQWELSDPLGDIRQPAGTKIYSNICPYVYRGPHCGYNGPPVADKNNKPTNDPLKDACSNTISGCEFRKLPDGSYRGLFFPAASSARDIL